MTHKIVTAGDGSYLSPETGAQRATIETLETGLDYPVQNKGLQSGKFVLPIWTDGDGGFFAIGRNGKLISITEQLTPALN